MISFTAHAVILLLLGILLVKSFRFLCVFFPFFSSSEYLTVNVVLVKFKSAV